VEPIVLRPGEGEVLTAGASSLTIMVDSAGSDGRLALQDSVIEAGFPGPFPHYHREMIDAFFVLEGTVEFLIRDERIQGGPGTFVLVPPGVVHTFANRTDAPARMLNLFLPGGLEGYLRELAAQGGPPTPETMARLAAKYDFVRAPTED
jgi:quercetin dioxygenase-like cupin family protein